MNEIELAAIAPAIRGVEQELMPMGAYDDNSVSAFVLEISGFIALTGGGWPPEQREEFIRQAASDLAGDPAHLLVPAIREARRRVFDPKRFVSWIVEAIAPDVAKLKVERDSLMAISSAIMDAN